MHEEDQIFQFKAALDKGIAAKVAESKPATLADAMKAAVAAEPYVRRQVGSSYSYHGGFGGSSGGRASSSSSSSGAAPMDLNNMNAEEADEEAEHSGVPQVNNVQQRAPTVEPYQQMMAKLEAMEHRIAFMSSAHSKGKNGRVPGLTREELEKLRKEGRCFRCKQKGHMKNECPKPLN